MECHDTTVTNWHCAEAATVARVALPRRPAVRPWVIGSCHTLVVGICSCPVLLFCNIYRPPSCTILLPHICRSQLALSLSLEAQRRPKIYCAGYPVTNFVLLLLLWLQLIFWLLACTQVARIRPKWYGRRPTTIQNAVTVVQLLWLYHIYKNNSLYSLFKECVKSFDEKRDWPLVTRTATHIVDNQSANIFCPTGTFAFTDFQLSVVDWKKKTFKCKHIFRELVTFAVHTSIKLMQNL